MTLKLGNQDEHWMGLALEQAQQAAAAGEVPVGAVVVQQGQLIGAGGNAPIQSHDPSAHAEVRALRAAAQRLGNYRLQDCTLFVTLEPCVMCAGAILQARIERLVFGAPDPKAGAVGSVIDVFSNHQLNHQTQVQGGVMEAACADLLQQFFQRQRLAQRHQADRSGRALRVDALRTPERCFANLPAIDGASSYVWDLASLDGLRLHYTDHGSKAAAETWLCLHGATDWSYAWSQQSGLPDGQGVRVVCPDLVGFGKSDKPKKAAFHTLAWHAQVLSELLERLDVYGVTVVAPEVSLPLAKRVAAQLPDRVLRVLQQAPPPLQTEARDAPFPAAGYRAALPAFAAMLNGQAKQP